jgi:hypothetical protein
MQVLNVLFKGLLKVSLITDFVAYAKFNALPLVGNVSDMLIKIQKPFLSNKCKYRNKYKKFTQQDR